MSAGLTAPDGFLWCRGGRPDAAWHLLAAGELAQGEKPRATAQSACGLWASLLPASDGWAEVVQRADPAPRRMCAACMAAVADAPRRVRLVTPPAAQARLIACC
jgi:hypothetical protein